MIHSDELLVLQGALCIWLAAGCYTFAYIVCVLNNQDVITHASVGRQVYCLRLCLSFCSSALGWPFLLALFKLKRTRAYKQACAKWLNQKGLQLHHHTHTALQ